MCRVSNGNVNINTISGLLPAVTSLYELVRQKCCFRCSKAVASLKASVVTDVMCCMLCYDGTVFVFIDVISWDGFLAVTALKVLCVRQWRCVCCQARRRVRRVLTNQTAVTIWSVSGTRRTLPSAPVPRDFSPKPTETAVCCCWSDTVTSRSMQNLRWHC